jgi:peptidoglycan hydrolase-like protein with peptidoglycan-binding domain
MRTALLLLGAVVVAGAVTVAAIGFGGATAPPPAASDLPPGEFTVTETDLVQTEKVAGTLSFGAPSAVTASGGGTVTWLPPKGSVVALGQPVYKVDEQPVTLVHGTVPPYRDLAAGVSGVDVTQFEQALSALGYSGFTVDDSFTSATTTAVAEWQEDVGLPETGVVGVGQIFVAPGDIRVASHEVPLGNAATAAVLTYTGTTRVVTVALDVAKQGLVTEGIAATVTLPDGTEVAGQVATVDRTTATPGEEAEPPTIGVTVAVADQAALGVLDSAPVSVTLVAAEKKGVLAVPVAALVALAEGGYGVQAIEDGEVEYVPVETGMFAAGMVEVSGVPAGTVVGVPE